MHALRPAIRILVATLGLLLGALPPAAAAQERAAPCVATARLGGTFLQPLRASAARPHADWRELFDQLHAVGVREVFLQWTSADGVAFYPVAAPDGAAGGDGAAPADRAAAASDADAGLVPLVFDLAEERGMLVWVGLAHDAGWWQGIDRARPPADVEVFLARRRLANAAVARAVAPSVVSRAAFAGWYVPDEIDDKNWLGDERGALVARYVADLAAELRAAAPGAPVTISGFTQGWATPAQVATLWSGIAGRARLPLVLLQDGVGAGKQTLADLAVYLPGLRAAVEAQGARLGIVVELFAVAPISQEAGGAASAFAAEPASLERVERQIALAERWASGPLVGFSVPDYMSAFGGPQAAVLYDAYRRWASRCAPAAR